MVKASVSGFVLAEDSGFESQVGRFLLRRALTLKTLSK